MIVGRSLAKVPRSRSTLLANTLAQHPLVDKKPTDRGVTGQLHGAGPRNLRLGVLIAPLERTSNSQRMGGDYEKDWGVFRVESEDQRFFCTQSRADSEQTAANSRAVDKRALTKGAKRTLNPRSVAPLT